MRVQVGILIAAIWCASGCNSTKTGIEPVGSNEVSPTEVERYLRRLHLDLVGQAATDEFVSSKRDIIIAADNTASSRAEVAIELLADPLWATTFIEELEGRLFGGDGFEFAYALQCNASRMNDPMCASCGPSADQCADCSCPAIVAMLEERTGLANAAADLTAGEATSGEIEQRYAASFAFRFGRALDALSNSLFMQFLGRAAEPDEVANATAMIVGFVVNPGDAAGLLFHRHGGTYEDLVDIVFESELYREAVVTRVFERLLGRIASPAELAHFSAELDPLAVDAKSVLIAVVSSGEYFNQ